jgi:uncharacterized membrane protein
MSTSPRIAAKLLAAATAVAMSIALAPSASAVVGTCGGNTYGGSSSPNTAALMTKRGGCNPFERIENAFDRFFHIPDRDDQQLQQQRAAK